MKFVSAATEWADENLRKLLSNLIFCSGKKSDHQISLERWTEETGLQDFGKTKQMYSLASSTLQEMRTDFQVTLEVCFMELKN